MSTNQREINRRLRILKHARETGELVIRSRLDSRLGSYILTLYGIKGPARTSD